MSPSSKTFEFFFLKNLTLRQRRWYFISLLGFNPSFNLVFTWVSAAHSPTSCFCFFFSSSSWRTMERIRTTTTNSWRNWRRCGRWALCQSILSQISVTRTCPSLCGLLLNIVEFTFRHLLVPEIKCSQLPGIVHIRLWVLTGILPGL